MGPFGYDGLRDGSGSSLSCMRRRSAMRSASVKPRLSAARNFSATGACVLRSFSHASRSSCASSASRWMVHVAERGSPAMRLTCPKIVPGDSWQECRCCRTLMVRRLTTHQNEAAVPGSPSRKSKRPVGRSQRVAARASGSAPPSKNREVRGLARVSRRCSTRRGIGGTARIICVTSSRGT